MRNKFIEISIHEIGEEIVNKLVERSCWSRCRSPFSFRADRVDAKGGETWGGNETSRLLVEVGRVDVPTPARWPLSRKLLVFQGLSPIPPLGPCPASPFSAMFVRISTLPPSPLCHLRETKLRWSMVERHVVDLRTRQTSLPPGVEIDV